MQLRNDITCFGKFTASKVGLISGRVEVTSSCYQRCKLCDSWRDHNSGQIRGEWELENLVSLVSEALEFPDFQFLGLTGGDPQAWSHLNGFLQWFIDVKKKLTRPLTLQLDTALMKLPWSATWREAVDRVRISLDAIDPEVYKEMRGVGSPEEIIGHMMEIKDISFSTLTAVCPTNLEEVPKIIQRLTLLKKQGLNLRKASFLAALGNRKGEQDRAFWERWYELGKEAECLAEIPVSFVGESIQATRYFCESNEAKEVRCWVPNVSFYAKVNGDFYPCCLIGGEALVTQEKFKIGNFPQQQLRQIWENYVPLPFYAHSEVCRAICQFKQTNLNRAAELAAKSCLAFC